MNDVGCSHSNIVALAASIGVLMVPEEELNDGVVSPEKPELGSISTVPYARGGLLSGILEPRSVGPSVGIVGGPQSWFGWGLVAQSLGWQIEWLVAEDDRGWELWRHHFPDVRRLHSFTRSILTESSVQVICFEGCLPAGRTHFIWETKSPLLHVLSTRLPPRPPHPRSQWNSTYIPWDHALSGGVTTLRSNCHLMTRRKMDALVLPPQPPRAVGSLLSTTPSSPSWPPVPLAIHHGRYVSWHSGSLLPHASRDTRVTTPSPLSQTGWVTRSLLPDELCSIFALPITLYGKASAQVQLKFFDCCSKFPPFGVLRLILGSLG